MITADGIKAVAAAYLGGQPDNAFTSPVRADPAGLPPMLFQVGSEEDGLKIITIGSSGPSVPPAGL